MSEAIAIAALGLIIAFGPRLLAFTANAQIKRPTRQPFWRMMVLRAALVAAFSAIYYFADSGYEYHGYPDHVSAWNGAALVVIAVILVDALWATISFCWRLWSERTHDPRP